MKRFFLFFLLLLSGTTVLNAQTIKIQGTVSNASDRLPVTGATIRAKGSPTGTTSDINGKFSLLVPDTSRLLVISFIGMKTQELPIKPFMEIELEDDIHHLDEAVVTAIGIKRDWKSLGYASTQVSGEELTKARESNLLNALAGKVAGVRITQSSGTPGGAAKIQIRGASSISSTSSPLFIVDGMPINNSAYNPDGQIGNLDIGNRAGDISLDDIESVNVLKGGAATALYGARAKDGAIIITTKQGRRKTKPVVSVNSSTRFETIAKLPDFQNEYAQGNEGEYNQEVMNGWGPSISKSRESGTEYINHKGEKTVLQAYPDNTRDFFQTGTSYINNLSLSGGSEKTDFRTGISSYNQKGIIPGVNYNRYNFTVNAGTDLFAGLSARITAQYILNETKGAPAQGGNDPNILISNIYLLPRTIDVNYLKNNWEDLSGDQIPVVPGSTTNNPYWLINKNKASQKSDRFIGNLLLSYSPIKGLTLSNNAGTDYYHEKRRKIYARGTIGEIEGKFQDRDISNRIINNDLLITYEKSWNDFSFKGIGGHNIQQEEWTQSMVTASQLTADGIYNYAIARQTSTMNHYSKKRLMGVFFDVGFSYKSIAFLNITGRNDWSSTLPKKHRSYFYPSISGSFVFSELMKNQQVLNFGKLRINYANVGSDTDPYQLNFQFSPIHSYTLQYSIVNTFPHNGLLGFSGPTTFPMGNLKPQNQSAFEIGTELVFLNDRIHLDFTYYRNVTTNQIVSMRSPASSGYYKNQINAGKLTNKGIEIALKLTPVKLKDFRWDINTNFASNKQVVNKITDEITTYTMATSFNKLTIGAETGKSFGIYGTGWARDDQGNYIIDEASGLRTTTNNVRLGDIYPKFIMGINNQFNYKGFNLNFLIDIRQGGKLYSGTVADLRSAGLAAETADGRETKLIEPGVIVSEDGTTRPNDIAISRQAYWGHIGNLSNAEGSIFNASYVKLREVALSYQFPGRWFAGSLVKSLHIGVEGRNLWLIKSHIPHIDPEVNNLGPSNQGEGVELNNVPSTRSFGLNIKLTL